MNLQKLLYFVLPAVFSALVAVGIVFYVDRSVNNIECVKITGNVARGVRIECGRR